MFTTITLKNQGKDALAARINVDSLRGTVVFCSRMAVDRNAVIREAQKLASKGQFDKAIAEWRKLVKESPNDANIFNTIGDLCLKKNAKSDAVDAYKRAADILAEDGFTSKAIALYKKVLNIDPSKIEVHLALGDMNADKGLTGNALESYKVVADHYKKQNNMAKALGIYQKMADLNPANVAFRLKLAEMYVKEGLKNEAVKAFLDAADQHIAKDAFQDARQLFEKVLSLEPNNIGVYHKAGIVYFKEGKYAESCKALRPVFEADPGNDELANLYLDALAKAGRAGDAEEVYRKLLSQDPARSEFRSKLYQVYLDKKDYDKALTEAVVLAEQKADAMDFEGAAELLKGFLDVTHDPVAGAGALADLFSKHGRASDGARELLQAADALIARGSTDDAREVLARAGDLAPDLDEIREKRESLSGDAEPERPAPDRGPGPSEEPAEFIEELDGEEPPAPVPSPGAGRGAEDPALAEALTEVDVLIKYGLGAKAVEQLEGIVRKYPDHASVRERLLDLYRGQKNTGKAVVQALLLAELHEKRGRMEESRSVLLAALDLAPGNEQIMAKLGLAAAEDEAPEDIEAIETIEEPEALEPIEAVPELAVPELELGPPAYGEVEELAIPDTDLDGEVEEGAFGAETDREETEEEAPRPRDHRAGAQRFPAAFDAAPAVPQSSAGAPLTETDIAELWAEAEFYYQQGLFDEARKHYEQVLELRPGDKRAMERLVELAREKEEYQEFSRLAEAVEGLESMVGAGPDEAEEIVTGSDVASIKSLMQEISHMRKGKAEAPAAPAPVVPAGRESAAAASEPEESFADLGRELTGSRTRSAAPQAAGAGGPEDFFDLAAELRDELSVAPARPTPATAHEQSLDEIFEEFKKGVEAHEKKEDEDTHYNLGVAYREMGLLDDAISEFNMTSEGEPKFIQSRYMLGLCYLEKEDYETAITEIQNALGYSYSFGEASEERIGMHYDLGLAFQGVGNHASALEEMQKVLTLDPTYREVETKVQELQQGDLISMDSIKEDIEKEISFKFLEEGARIEREEKTKKVKK